MNIFKKFCKNVLTLYSEYSILLLGSSPAGKFYIIGGCQNEKKYYINRLTENGTTYFTVKAYYHPRGVRTLPVSEIKVGDEVVIDNYFTEVIGGCQNE